MNFHRAADGSYVRRPTRGLDIAGVLYPDGGGLEFCWLLRRALEPIGVQMIDRLYITGQLRSGRQVVGAVGIDSRTGQFHAIKARTTIVCTNAITFRSGFVRAFGLRRRCDAAQRRVQLCASRHAQVLLRGHHVRDSGRRAVGQCRRHAVHAGLRAGLGRRGRRPPHRTRHGGREEEGARPDVSRHVGYTRAHARRLHRQQGQVDGLFLPQARKRSQDRHVRQDTVLRAQSDDQDGRADQRGLPIGCPGLLAAGLAQAGCANHFAGFHIGLCVGNG